MGYEGRSGFIPHVFLHLVEPVSGERKEKKKRSADFCFCFLGGTGNWLVGGALGRKRARLENRWGFLWEMIGGGLWMDGSGRVVLFWVGFVCFYIIIAGSFFE
jgi:hypothetical protein